jgi:TonB-dependent receptor
MPKRPARTHRVIAALLATLALAGAAQAEDVRRQFNISPGPAPRAVAEFARQAGVNVLADGARLAPLQFPELRGSYTVTEALGRLLAGSGLAGSLTAGGSVFIEPAPAPPPVKEEPPAAAPVPPPAAAQTPPVVLVSGFRASLDTAQDMKREAVGIVDAIVSEDVAKFPDSNLAESLQRVPGVALIRGEGGEGRQITVRGLSPTFTRVRINGIEAAAASGASDINGSTNRTRSFDFSVFASELFGSLKVHKTSEVDIDEGSLGATVDLRAPRPFDFKGPALSLGGQMLTNSVARRTEPRLSGLVSARWDTPFGKVGALVSGAYAKRRATVEGYEAVELLAASSDGGFCSPLGARPQTPANDPVKGIDAARCGVNVPRTANPAAYELVMGHVDDYGGTVAQPAPGSGAFHPRLPRYRRSQTDYVRSGLTGALQWRPDRDTELALDTMFGRFANARTDQYMAALSFGRTLGLANGKPQTSILDAHFDADGSWDYGRFDAVDVRSEALLDDYTASFRQHVFTASRRFDNGLRLRFVHGVSASRLDNPVRTTVQFDAPNVNGFSWDFRRNRNVPTIDFGIDVTNPANFTFGPQDADGTYHGAYSDRALDTRNRLRTTGIEAGFPAAAGMSVKFGVSTRRNTWRNEEFGSQSAGLALPAGVPLADVSRLVTGFGRGLGGSGVPSSWVTVDLPKLLAVYNIQCHCDAVPGSQFNYFSQVYRVVDEGIDAAYGKLDFRLDAGGVPVRGNVGLRAVRTGVAATAKNDADGTMVPTTIRRSYRDWLPALNLVAGLRSDVDLRFSTGKTMSRPEYVDLAPSATLTPYVQNVVLGNPRLDPIRARTYDLQAEWYYAKNALASVGVFRKETTSFIQNVSQRLPWSALGLPNSLLVTGGCAISGAPPVCPTLPDTVVVANRKVNTPGGPLNGIELNLQLPFSVLPVDGLPFLRHAGLLANATRVHSRITYITRLDNPNTPANEQLTEVADFTGLSPRTHNLTLYYDDRRLSARVLIAHRSSYLMDVLGNVAGHDYTFADGSTHVDMSVSYALTSSLRLRVEGQNLLDAPLRYGRDSQRNDTLLYVHSGRSLSVGLSYNR